MIQSLYGFNKSDGTKKLIAIQGNRIVHYNDAGGWTKPGQSVISSATNFFETFMNNVFLVNGVDANRTFNGSSWSTTTLLGDAPKAYGIVRQDVRLFLLKPEILGTSYKSMFWYSDLPEEVTSGGLSWGFESGTNLGQTAASGVVTSSGATFKTNNVKVGDPFYITTGTNAGKYVVQSIDTETQITLTKALVNTTTNSSFWVGGNYEYVNTDDGDELITGIEAFNELVLYKRNSVHRYNIYGNELRQIKNVLGTTSPDSVIANGSFVYHYHPSKGFIRIDGTQGIEISAPYQDFVDAITNTTGVIGWTEKDKYLNWYVGDITTRDGETITNCVLVFNTVTNQWSHKQLPYRITSKTDWYVDNTKKTYLGTYDNRVFNTPYGYSYGDYPVNLDCRTHAIFPAGEGVVLDFRRLRVFLERPCTFEVRYRLIYMPQDKHRDTYINEKDWHPLKGNTQGNMVELVFSRVGGGTVRASGVELMFVESSTTKGPVIEKVRIYYSEVGDV